VSLIITLRKVQNQSKTVGEQWVK